MSDVNEFCKNNIEEKRKPRGQNSFVPKEPFYEFQFDLFFINDIPNQKMKVGALMIDIFSKGVTVIPMQSKSEGDVAMALVEGFQKMGGFCKLLFTDDESALNTVKRWQDDVPWDAVHRTLQLCVLNHVERCIRSNRYSQTSANCCKG